MVPWLGHSESNTALFGLVPTIPPSLPAIATRQPWYNRITEVDSAQDCRGHGIVESASARSLVSRGDDDDAPESSRILCDDRRIPSPYGKEPLRLRMSFYGPKTQKAKSAQLPRGIARRAPKLHTKSSHFAKTGGQSGRGFGQRRCQDKSVVAHASGRDDAEFYHPLPIDPQAQYPFPEPDDFSDRGSSRLIQASTKLQPLGLPLPLNAVREESAVKMAPDGTSKVSPAVERVPAQDAFDLAAAEDWPRDDKAGSKRTKVAQNAETFETRVPGTLPCIVASRYAKGSPPMNPRSHWLPKSAPSHTSEFTPAGSAGFAPPSLPAQTAADLSREYSPTAQAAAQMAERYRDPLTRLQDQQAEWRRRHDALAKRRSKKLEAIAGSDAPQDESVARANMTEPAGFYSSRRRGNSKKPSLPPIAASNVSDNQTSSSRAYPRARSKPQAFIRIGATSEQPRDTQREQFEPALPPNAASDAGDEEVVRKSSKSPLAKPKEDSFAGLKAGKPILGGRSRANTMDEVVFSQVLQVSKQTNLSVDEVHDKMKDFIDFDTGGNGSLSLQEFEFAVRKVCNVRPGSPVPAHLLARHWSTVDSDGDGKVSFEEYVAWSMEVAYSEEALVPNAGERILRALAREHGIPIGDVEKIRIIFDEFDTDGSGNIENEEFFNVIMKLMNVKNPSDVSPKKLQRYWVEVDADGSGEVSFEEFFLWYIRVGGGAGL